MEKMETKGKKKLMNLVMVLLILVIAASGILTVGKLKGWFEKAEDVIVSSGQTKGVVNIQRQGIGYTLKEETPLHSEDVIETKKGAQAELLWQQSKTFILNGNTEVVLNSCTGEQLELEIRTGELFADAGEDATPLKLIFSGTVADLADAVFSVSVQDGSSQLSLYDGDISVYLEDGTQERLEAGEYLSVVNSADGAISYQINEIPITSLNEFLLTQAQNCSSAEELCFAQTELQQVLDDRAAEKQAALEASLKAEAITAADETETEEAEEKTSESAQQNQEEAVSGSVETIVPEQPVQEEKNICTITILCDTILDNMDNLDAGKEAYVPANGTILATSSVEFEDGETVFDVLTRVCEYAGIQIEYSWTAIYNSYYIEGINNLYEFDCGNESGWMYKVNGWFPNYGCSSYELENGDNIVWCYTCNGLGADVGGAAY